MTTRSHSIRRSHGHDGPSTSGNGNGHEPICLVVRGRPFDERAVLGSVLARGYIPVESGTDSVDVVLAWMTPEVAVVALDATRPGELDLIHHLSEAGTYVIVLALRQDQCAPALAAGADVCLDDAAVHSTLGAQLVSAQRRAAPREQTEPVGQIPLTRDVILDANARRLVTAHRTVQLTAFEFALLELMALHAGHILSAAELIETVRGEPVEPQSAAITAKAHILRLRRKFANAGVDPGILKTVRGGGYMVDRDTE